MEHKFKVKRVPISVGNSIYMPLPADFVKYLEIEFNEDGKPTTVLSIMPDYSEKHGRFIAAWNKEQQKRQGRTEE